MNNLDRLAVSDTLIKYAALQTELSPIKETAIGAIPLVGPFYSPLRVAAAKRDVLATYKDHIIPHTAASWGGGVLGALAGAITGGPVGAYTGFGHGSAIGGGGASLYLTNKHNQGVRENNTLDKKILYGLLGEDTRLDPIKAALPGFGTTYVAARTGDDKEAAGQGIISSLAGWGLGAPLAVHGLINPDKMLGRSLVEKPVDKLKSVAPKITAPRAAKAKLPLWPLLNALVNYGVKKPSKHLAGGITGAIYGGLGGGALGAGLAAEAYNQKLDRKALRATPKSKFEDMIARFKEVF